MRHDAVLTVCWPEAEPLQRELVTAAARDWPRSPAPWFFELTPSDLTAGELPCDDAVVWLMLGPGEEGDGFYEALELVAQRQMPALLTRTHESLPAGTMFQPGAIIVPPGLDPASMQLVLRTVFGQVELIAHMRHELGITQRHHGGLRGQMDKLDEELRLAARVQYEFLPDRLPQIGKVQTEVMFRPAGYVSGDIYDIQRLDEHHLGLWIADVVGHGVPAALMTMFVKRALPTKDITDDGYRLVPPGEALARLNDEMCARASGGARFATAAYAVIDTRDHHLTVARAGHPAPMLMHANGDVEYLEPDGALLGVFPGETFESTERDLGPGDRLVIYSDGLETAFPEGDDHNTNRYREELAALRGTTCAEAIQRFENQIDGQPGSLHQVDDMTVLMMGIGERTTPTAPPRHKITREV